MMPRIIIRTAVREDLPRLTALVLGGVLACAGYAGYFALLGSYC